MNPIENCLLNTSADRSFRKNPNRSTGFGRAVVATILLLTSSFSAVSQVHGAGTTGANFLTLGSGARIEAMGGCGTALAHGVDAVYWNAASLGRCALNEFSFSHAAWFADIGYEHLGYVHPLGNATSLAFSTSILHTGGIPRTLEDPYGVYMETDGSFSYTAMTVSTSMGRCVAHGFYVGGSTKFLYENNASETAVGVAFDICGLYASPDARWSAGVAARNLGRGLKLREITEPLPVELAFGGAVALADSSLITSLDVTLTTDAGTRFCWGAEKRLRRLLSLRGGYTSSTEKTAHRGFTVGAGISLRGFSLDYSASDFQDLGFIHRFTLSIGTH